MYCDKSLPLGHDEPPRKNTYIENKQRTRTINLGLNVGARPSGTAGFTLSKADGTTVQAADDTVRLKIKKLHFYIESNIQPSPHWIVKSESTEQNPDCCSALLNTKIYRLSPLSMVNHHHMNLDVKYGMSVELAYPIEGVCNCHIHAVNSGCLMSRSHLHLRIIRKSRLSIGTRYTAGLQSSQRHDGVASFWWLL